MAQRCSAEHPLNICAKANLPNRFHRKIQRKTCDFDLFQMVKTCQNQFINRCKQYEKPAAKTSSSNSQLSALSHWSWEALIPPSLEVSTCHGSHSMATTQLQGPRNFSPGPPEPSRTLRNQQRNFPQVSGTLRNCDLRLHTPDPLWVEDPVSLRCWGTKKM